MGPASCSSKQENEGVRIFYKAKDKAWEDVTPLINNNLRGVEDGAGSSGLDTQDEIATSQKICKHGRWRN